MHMNIYCIVDSTISEINNFKIFNLLKLKTSKKVYITYTKYITKIPRFLDVELIREVISIVDQLKANYVA